VSSPIQRLDTWARRTGYVLSIPAGQLYDDILARPLTDADSFTLAARAWADDDLPVPTAITGASSVALTWSAATQRWVCELPYVTAFNALPSVRVIATITAGGATHDLMDARVTFVKADGR
jgi:hypothetical protein